MNKSKAALAAAVVVALVSAQRAEAAEAEYGPWSIGVAVGQTSWEEPDPVFNTTLEDDAVGYKLMVGYRPFRHVGIEANYWDSGTASDTLVGIPVEASGDGFGVTALGLLPLADRFMLHARAGVISWDVEGKAVGNGIVARTSNSGDDLIWGVGGAVHWERGAWLRLEYESLEADQADVTLISLALIWTF